MSPLWGATQRGCWLDLLSEVRMGKENPLMLSLGIAVTVLWLLNTTKRGGKDAAEAE